MTFAEWKINAKENLYRWWSTFHDFFFYGALGAVFPFLPLYYRALGLEPWHIGVLGGLRPLLAMVCGPIWCCIGNKYKARKTILVASLLAWIIFTLPIGFIDNSEEGVCFHGAPQSEMTITQNVRKDLHSQGQYSDVNDTLHSPVFQSLQDVTKREPPSGSEINDSSETKMSRFNPYARSIFTEIFVLVVIGEFLQSSTDIFHTHFDGTIVEPLAVLYNQDGRNNLWSVLGMSIFAFLTGFILSNTTAIQVCNFIYGNYIICFIIFGILMTFALAIASRFEYHYRRRSRHTKIQFTPLMFCHRGHIYFIIIIMFMGIIRGALNNFVFWHLAEIGGLDVLIGLLVVIQCFSDTIANISSPHIMVRIGYTGMIFLGLASNGLRFLIYSYIETPSSTWVALAVESLHGINDANVWSALILYITNYTPPETFPTGLLIVQGLYLGLGAGMGSIIAGIMISFFGVSTAFKLLAFVSVFVCLFVVFTHSFDQEESLPGEAPSIELYSDDEAQDEDTDIEWGENKVVTKSTYLPLDGEETTIYDASAQYVMPNSGPPFVQIYMSFIQKEPSKG